MKIEDAREVILQLRDQFAIGATSAPGGGLEAKVEALDTILAALDEQRVTDTYTFHEGLSDDNGQNRTTKASRLADPLDLDAVENLDDAVHYWLAEQQRRRGANPSAVVSGWLLLVSTQLLSRVDPSRSPLVTGATYAAGPQTSITEALGLAAAGQATLKTILEQEMNDGEH